MNSINKAELLKDTIYQLYSKEGRTYSYIGRLLGIDRSIISKKVVEWEFPEPEPHRYAAPSTQKFINANRDLIKSRLDKDVTIKAIASELKVGTKAIYTAISYDGVLKQAFEEHNQRAENAHLDLVAGKKKESGYNYDIQDIPGETWKDVVGYPGYKVSSKGRVKAFAKRYQAYYLLTPTPNKNNGRLYVALVREDGKTKNLQLSRVVAFAFCDGHSDENNTVNHKDGDINNNTAENLEWVSQATNNLHAYRALHRNVVNHRRYKFKELVYKKKYHFKTVVALAKFIGKSETETRRYLDNPDKHEIEFIN